MGRGSGVTTNAPRIRSAIASASAALPDVDARERVASSHLGAGLCVDRDPDGGIDLRVRARAPGAHRDRREPDGQGVDARDEAGASAPSRRPRRARPRAAPARSRRAGLPLAPRSSARRRAPRRRARSPRSSIAPARPRRRRAVPPSTIISAPSASVHSTRSRRPAAAQDVDRLARLVGVPDGDAERRVHVGQQRDDLLPGARPHAHERLRERARARLVLHERPAADLHVEHEPVDPLGELLREDRRHDERDALDGRRHVAERVDALVGGGDLARLPDHARAHARRRSAAKRSAEMSVRKPGDRLELVERPARVAEPAAAHHGHRHAARGDERREAEAHLVADAAGRVLVDLEPGDAERSSTRPEWSIASVSATVSASSRPRKKTAMSQRGHLVVRERSVHVARSRGARFRPRRGASPSRLAARSSTRVRFIEAAEATIAPRSSPSVPRRVRPRARPRPACRLRPISMPTATLPPRPPPALRLQRVIVFVAFAVAGGGMMGLNAGCSRLFGTAEEEDSGVDAAPVVDAGPFDAADATPPPDARTEQERLAFADAGRFCGTKGLPDCPMQLWMKQNATTMITFGETTTLAEVFDRDRRARPARHALAGYPFPNWVSIARDGADASRTGNIAAARSRLPRVPRPVPHALPRHPSRVARSRSPRVEESRRELARRAVPWRGAPLAGSRSGARGGRTRAVKPGRPAGEVHAAPPARSPSRRARGEPRRAVDCRDRLLPQRDDPLGAALPRLPQAQHADRAASRPRRAARTSGESSRASARGPSRCGARQRTAWSPARGVFEPLKGSALFDALDLVHREVLQVASRPARGPAQGEIHGDTRLDERFFYVGYPAISYARTGRGDRRPLPRRRGSPRRPVPLPADARLAGAARGRAVGAHPYAVLLAPRRDLARRARRRRGGGPRVLVRADRRPVPPRARSASRSPRSSRLRLRPRRVRRRGGGGPEVRVLVEFDARVADEIRAAQTPPHAEDRDGTGRTRAPLGDPPRSASCPKCAAGCSDSPTPRASSSPRSSSRRSPRVARRCREALRVEVTLLRRFARPFGVVTEGQTNTHGNHPAQGPPRYRLRSSPSSPRSPRSTPPR